MYRILIVDNEPYVVDWIASLVETSDKEVDVCRAYTAKGAIEWLSKTRIDVLVSDICMPGMDGLELAGIVKEQWPYAKVVLITAFAEFDYAVAAIRNNVVSFILKNQGDEIILKEVERAMELVDADIRKAQEAQTKVDIRPALAQLRNRFFRELLENDSYGMTDTGAVSEAGDVSDNINVQLKYLEIPLSADTPIWIMLSSVQNTESSENIIEHYLAGQNMVNQVEQCLGDCYNIYSVEMSDNRTAWILCAKQQGNYPVKEPTLIQGRIELLQETVYSGCSFILYPEKICLNGLRDAWLKLERTLNSMSVSSESFFIMESADNEDGRLDMEVISRRVRIWLEKERKDLFLESLAYYRRIINDRGMEQKDCYNLYYAVAIQLHYYLETLELPESQSIISRREKLFCPPMGEGWKHKFDELYVLAEETFALEQKVKSSLTQNTVEELKKYIKEHVSEDISLTRLSEISGYNTHYLSRIFRAQTGRTLTEYIGQKKLERISELMKDSRLNINDVAEKTGFQTRTYFNRFIKKWTGKSPKDYRAELLWEENKG